MEKEKNLSVDINTGTGTKGSDGTREYIKRIKTYDVLTREEEQELLRRWRENNDKDAYDELIAHNLKLVVSIAFRYRERGLPLDDLIQYGNLGLMRGLQNFDNERGTKLSTYVTSWIEASITRALLEKTSTVRVPARKTQEMRRIRKIQENLAGKLGRTPTKAEVALEADCSVEDIDRLERISAGTVSLDSKFNDEADDTFAEVIADDEYDDGLDEVFAQEQKHAILRAMSKLTEREQKVITLKFGLDGKPGRTLEEIGRTLNPDKPVSKERVRQISLQAILRLRDKSGKTLKEFLAED